MIPIIPSVPVLRIREGPTVTDGEDGKTICEEAFRDAETDGPDGKQMERPSWCWVRPWPAAGVFYSSSFFWEVIGATGIIEDYRRFRFFLARNLPNLRQARPLRRSIH